MSYRSNDQKSSDNFLHFILIYLFWHRRCHLQEFQKILTEQYFVFDVVYGKTKIFIKNFKVPNFLRNSSLYNKHPAESSQNTCDFWEIRKYVLITVNGGKFT